MTRELPNAVIFTNFLTHEDFSDTSLSVIVKVLVTGANGLVGSAIVRRLQAEPSIETIATTRIELNLLDEQATSAYLGRVKPEALIPRNKATQKLRALAIETRPIVAGNLAKQPVIRRFDWLCQDNLPGASVIRQHGFYVGLHSQFNDGDIERVISTPKSVLPSN